jgi:hypothetical protein
MPFTMSAGQQDLAVFEQTLGRMPAGYREGVFQKRRWGATVKRSGDSRRVWLFAEDLAGTDIVSFNLYRMTDGRTALKPCEMSSTKVIDFVMQFRPDACGFDDRTES